MESDDRLTTQELLIIQAAAEADARAQNSIKKLSLDDIKKLVEKLLDTFLNNWRKGLSRESIRKYIEELAEEVRKILS